MRCTKRIIYSCCCGQKKPMKVGFVGFLLFVEFLPSSHRARFELSMDNCAQGHGTFGVGEFLLPQAGRRHLQRGGGTPGQRREKWVRQNLKKARMATRQRGQIGVGREGDKRRHYCTYKVLCTSPPSETIQSTQTLTTVQQTNFFLE